MLENIAGVLLVGVGAFLAIFTKFVEKSIIGSIAIDPLTDRIIWWVIFLVGIMAICFGALIPLASVRREKKSE